MHVRVHAARQYEQPAGVNKLRIGVLDVFFHAADDFALKENVCFSGDFGSNDGAIFDERFHKNLISLSQRSR